MSNDVPVAALVAQAVGPCVLLSLVLVRRIAFNIGELRRVLIGLAGRLLPPFSLALCVSWLSGPATHWLAFISQVGTYLFLILVASLILDRKLVASLIAPLRGRSSAIVTYART